MARTSGIGLQRDAVGLMSVLFMHGPLNALALVPVLLAAFGVDFAHLGITGLTWPANLAPLICLAWMVLGLIPLGYFGVRDRSRIAETRRVFTEQTPAEREHVQAAARPDG